jgi:hypothetical protein
LIVNRKKIHVVLGVLLITLFIFPLIFNNKTETTFGSDSTKNIHPSLEIPHTTQWIENPTMEAPIEPTWFWVNGTEGDNSDVEATSSPGQADLRILGEEKTFSDLYGTPNSSTSLGWKEFQNGDFLLPDVSEINTDGCFVYHYLDEGTGGGQVYNYPSVHWKNNISISDDMSDYSITSASIEVIFNASVDENVDTPNDPFVPIQPYIDQFAIGDDVTFYVEISDLQNSYSFRVGEFKSEYLGQYYPGFFPSILNITDRDLNYVDERDLISALTSVLAHDNHNFTITLGMDIYCEDNSGSGDDDEWDALYIKTCNLTFTYEKKIDPFTTISWNQIGNQLNGPNIQITGATFNFEYKVDTLWPTTAPLSEIRFLINNKLYTQETIKLSSATTILQEAKVGGYDVRGLVDKDVNISVSIEVYLKDKFDLDEMITISFDNVFLNISYIETLPDKETDLQLFLNTANKTSDPVIEVIKDTLLNITVTFTNETGDHISGAIIEVRGDKLLENLTEYSLLEQYSRTINTTDDLILGVNVLTIEAIFPGHETIKINPRITVRKIQAELSTLTGSNTININSGNDVSLEIALNNTDYGGTITDAYVTYTWEGGDGILTDLDNDGIYTGVIPNVPSGTYTITISAFAGDDFELQNYQVTLNVLKVPGTDWSWLVYILIGAIVGLGTFIFLYQTHFKYPPIVRKIRKLRKKVGKGKAKIKPIDINKRENVINIILKDKMGILQLQEDTVSSEKIQKIEKEHKGGDGK